MAATERFAEIMARPDLPLDEAALLIAAHDHPVDVAGELALLDALAADAPDDPDALAQHLFVRLEYRGNTTQYYDPRNSFLDEVRRRRLGLPITLSVLMLEVGRRRGLALHGVGMPGHFLVGAGSGVFYDPFHGGSRLDGDECRRQFTAHHGAGVPFSADFLAPTSSGQIVARMLANLSAVFVPRDPVRATWALRLRLAVPGTAPRVRQEIATMLGRLGHSGEAARELEAILPELDGSDVEQAKRDLAGFRARDN